MNERVAADRRPVESSKAYRLMNHGPTVIVTSRHGGRSNIMSAAWSMPLDFDPPKVAVVIDKSTFTRGLTEASGEFALNIPSRAQARLTVDVGNQTGAEVDKFAAHGIPTAAESKVAAPLVEGRLGRSRRVRRRALEDGRGRHAQHSLRGGRPLLRDRGAVLCRRRQALKSRRQHRCLPLW